MRDFNIMQKRYGGAQCVECRHYDPMSFPKACAAFPGGIPDRIWHCEHDHELPFPGDNGIHFEPASEAEMQERMEIWDRAMRELIGESVTAAK